MPETAAHPQMEALLRDAHEARSQRPRARERAVEVAAAMLLVAAVGAMCALTPDVGSASPALGALLVAAYVAANRVQFSVGAGYAPPTELVLVPMLVLMPPATVPGLVALGVVIARLPEIARRTSPPDRALLAIGDAWHAVGPALVLILVATGPPRLGLWPVYALALAAQFVFDTAAAMAREWMANGVAPRLQARVLGLVVAVDAALAPIGLLTALVAVDHPAAIVLVLPLIALLGALGQERERRIEHTLALSAAYRGSALLVGEMLEADDAYTGGEHTAGVVQLCLAVGAELKLSPSEYRDLEFGALLHDVGKLRTPNEIINKPGALTPEEWDIIRRHPADGQAMLDRIGGVLTHAGRIVRSHHERWDGGGYPDGLRGEEIPLAARIVCACDAYSAMTTNRSYRPALPAAEAIAELRRCAGAQFDPRVVEALLKVVEASDGLADATPVRLAA